MGHIFRHLKSAHEEINTINIFSDGPSSQFKQKYLFSNLWSWEEEHDAILKWNFFATSHGKGVVDGIGGTVKRAVWRHVKSDQVHICTPQEYARVAQERCPNIHIEYVSRESTTFWT